MVIPRGIEVYSPYGPGVERDIALARGEVAYIFSSASPLGRNIKLNKCAGYLENSLDFTPALPRSCPRDANRAEIVNLKGKCQDYILSLGTCAEPDINHRDVIDDRECQVYLVERYGYRGCFDRYSGDADFLSGEWHVWAKELFPDLDDRHDRVLLFDREGLLVDLYTY